MERNAPPHSLSSGRMPVKKVQKKITSKTATPIHAKAHSGSNPSFLILPLLPARHLSLNDA
ncbi:hypothetical protein C4578_01345 [Candidatus Microgenomates bacterium]|nr:MAG: hypothetical protein C4578_01345 [Candidatus Microgenomates bacterium]